jgi:hypothetical protein
MKVDIKKLPIKPSSQLNLPIFYNYISYINMAKGDPHFRYNENLSSFIQYGTPEKYISKIVDFSIINNKEK